MKMKTFILVLIAAVFCAVSADAFPPSRAPGMYFEESDGAPSGYAYKFVGPNGTMTLSAQSVLTYNPAAIFAPIGAQYLVSALDGSLTAEDVVTEGLAIDYTNGAGTGTFAFDPTELTGARSFNDGTTDASFTWTFDLSAGTDPTFTFGNNLMAFNTPIVSSSLTNAAALALGSTTAGVNITTHTDATDDFTVNTTMLVVEGDSGNVGIGTTAPGADLHVYDIDAPGLPFIIENQQGIYREGKFGFYTGSSQGFGGSDNSLSIANIHDASGDIGLRAANSGNVQFILKGDGKVGIGTAAPNYLFHLHKTASPILQFTTGDTGTTPGDGFIFEMGVGGAGQVDTQFWNYEAGYFRFGTNNAEVLRMTSAGNVGIGTASPDTRFHAELDSANTNVATVVGRLSVTSTGTPAAGLGPSLGFEVETAAGAPGNQEVVAAIDGIATDVTGAAEVGALVFKTMRGGAAADERFRSDGVHSILLPLENDAVTPTLAFGDGGDGYYNISDGLLGTALNGVLSWNTGATAFYGIDTSAPAIRNENASATNPIYTTADDGDTGQGRAAADQLSLIAGGVEGQRITETSREIEANATVCQDDTGIEIVTVAAHALGVGDVVTFAAGTGALCTGITAGTNYYVIDVDSTTTFEISATKGGSIVAYTDTGTAFTSNETTTVTDINGSLEFDDGVDTHIIKGRSEVGRASSLIIGLDETDRTMVIADAGDVDTDLGLAAAADPTLYILENTGGEYVKLSYNNLAMRGINIIDVSAGGDATTFSAEKNMVFTAWAARDTGSKFAFDSGGSLTDTDGEQSWLYVETEINQSGTAAYNGLHVNVLETTPGTSIGDGTTGQGNNLLLLERESASVFKVDRLGMVTFVPETVTCVAEAGTASVSIRTSHLVTDGDADTDEDTVALADGELGDEKVFVYLTETDAGDSVNVTPTTGLGFTDILFEDPGDGCIMTWTASGWAIVSNNGGTIT